MLDPRLEHLTVLGPLRLQVSLDLRELSLRFILGLCILVGLLLVLESLQVSADLSDCQRLSDVGHQRLQAFQELHLAQAQDGDAELKKVTLPHLHDFGERGHRPGCPREAVHVVDGMNQ